MNKDILVLGVGNLLLKDEGVGIHVIQALEKEGLPPNVSGWSASDRLDTGL